MYLGFSLESERTWLVFCVAWLDLLQECFQSGVDTDCTPVPAKGNAAQSFPMDKPHGFGVAQDKVWDGSVEDPATGLCQEGTPDADGRFQNSFMS